MNRQWIAIVDQDTEYTKRLADYLNGKRLQGVFAVAFSSKESWDKYETKEDFRVALLGEGTAFSEKDFPQETRCIRLTENHEKEPGTVCKYQSGEALLKEILAERGGDSRICKENCRFIGVYSPIRRSLKTSFSLALGQYFGERGKTLVISLDVFSGLSGLLGKSGFDLAEVLYYWKHKEDWKEFFYQAVVPVQSMEVLLPVWNPLDMEILGSMEICDFLSDVMKLGRYETVILDVGEARANVTKLLVAMEHIYTPIGWDTVDKEKLLDYQRFLGARGLESIQEKTEYITFPALEELTTCENYIEELLWGRFYSFVAGQIMHS